MKFMTAIRTILAKSPGYAAVRDRSNGRDAVTIENKSEDELLKGRKRLQLVSTQRDAFRNTTFAPASALQLQINVVGTVGGRLTVIGPDGKIDENATKTFRHWARHADFTRGMSLNEMLRLLLTQLTHTGGDFIAVLDCGELTHADAPTLRVKIFEPDQIHNIPDGAFDKLYPSGDFYQVDGIVKDKYDRIVSAFVGNRRGVVTFEDGEYLHLKDLSNPGDFSDSNWIHVGCFDRPNQTRGISPLVHVANTLADLATIQGSEIAATKLNSALGIVLSDESAADAFAVSSHGDFDESDEVTDSAPAAAADSASDDPDAAENAALKTAQTRLTEGNAAIIKLAPNKKLDSFKTERPNLNVVEMYDRLTDVSGTVLGLTQMYTRLKPQGSYSAARAEMVLVRPVFEMWKKVLERNFLDWLAVRVLDALGVSSDGLADRLLWSWPKADEVDEGSNQTALQKKFLNGEVNLIDIHGADTEKFLDRRAIENEMCKSRGIVPPWEVTTSGMQLVTEPTTENPEKETPDAG